jgi:hypothetical protein
MRAEKAGVRIGNVAADRTIRDAILDVAHRVHQPLDLFPGRLEHVKREPLGTLGADSGKALQLLDEAGKRIGAQDG